MGAGSCWSGSGGEWEPVAEVPAGCYLRLDTDGTPSQTMDRLLLEIFARRIDLAD